MSEDQEIMDSTGAQAAFMSPALFAPEIVAIAGRDGLIVAQYRSRSGLGV